MKIVHAVPWYLPHGIGGTEIYVSTLCAALHAAGHEVVVAVPTPGAASHTEAVVDGIRVLRYATPATPTRAEALELVSTDGTDMFVQWVRREAADIVHFHTLTTGLGVREVAAVHAMGIATVFTSHSGSLGYICQRGTLLRWGSEICRGPRSDRECAACMLQLRGIPRGAASTVSHLMRRNVTGNAGRARALLQMKGVSELARARQAELVASLDAFVLLTQWAADIVLANGADPARVFVNRLGIRDDPKTRNAGVHPGGVSNGAREVTPDSVQRHAPLRIGYLGRYDDIKGVTVLAEAAAGLPRDAAIEVVFRGPQANPRDAHVAANVRSVLGADERFIVGDIVPPDDIYAFLSGLDVLCCPSLCAEGGPTVALEARAVGVPVIGSNIGGLAEIVRDGMDGALAAPGDAAALRDIMVALANDPATISRWRSALGPVRRMTDVANDYLTLYGSICKHASAS